jgi:diguanylate cyclase
MKRTMNNISLLEQTRQYIRIVLPLMSQHNIPITPQNYTVWYKYVSSGEKELTKAIDTMIREGSPFTDEANEDLYQQFCVVKDDGEMRKIREDLKQVLLTILHEVTEFTDQTDEYEKFVTKSVDILSDEASMQEIRIVISEIIDKTKTLGQFGKSVRGKLKETTQALETLKRDLEVVKTEAAMDFLTGVANRKLFESTLDQLLSETEASRDRRLSLLLIDIDRFKNFNDQHGHLIGDEVLRFVAKKIKEMVKGQDLVARFGGEEFTVILPETPFEGAMTVAENIRKFFSTTSLKAKTSSKTLGSITVSIGIASYRPGDTSEGLVQQADRALYAAKEKGRNCVMPVEADG